MLTEATIFVCAGCERLLTRPVRQLADLPQRVAGDYPVRNPPTVEQGTWASDRDLDGGTPVLHLADVLEQVPHPDGGRENGCCGRDGLEGPNLLCPGCQREVATVRDDCWTFQEVRLVPGAVRSIPAPGAPYG